MKEVPVVRRNGVLNEGEVTVFYQDVGGSLVMSVFTFVSDWLFA